jgi:nitroreductase
MMLNDMVKKNRSYRRFFSNEPVSMETLRELVELARLSPSGSNLQPLKFMLSNDKSTNALIFPHTMWAGYLKDWGGPIEEERPAAYIILLGDKDISKNFGCDHGIAAQTMLLGAVEKGLGGCMIGSIKREGLRQALKIPDRFEILLILALGKPKEEIIIENVGSDGNIKYWRDQTSRHHVPKRSIDELIINSPF